MNILFASDIHGSAAAARKLAEHVESFQPDRIVLLGDLLYHGPRNPLPQGYGPKEVAEVLNGFADRVMAVRGNCDAEVDQWMLNFPCLAEYALLADGPSTFFLTHGHRPGLTPPDDLPPLAPGTVFVSGHTHVKVLKREGDIVFLNPGSISLPKDDGAGFATFDGQTLALRRFEDAAVIKDLCL